MQITMELSKVRGFVVADDLCYGVVFVGLGVFVESGEGVGVDMSVILKSGISGMLFLLQVLMQQLQLAILYIRPYFRVSITLFFS